jgi:hypothetical protein
MVSVYACIRFTHRTEGDLVATPPAFFLFAAPSARQKERKEVFGDTPNLAGEVPCTPKRTFEKPWRIWFSFDKAYLIRYY